jgi:hypothetical protein
MTKSDLMYVRTTGEPVIVLSKIDSIADESPKVNVRRPVVSDQNGIIHVVDQFFEFELSTEDEYLSARIQRAKNEQVSLEAIHASLNAEKVN